MPDAQAGRTGTTEQHQEIEPEGSLSRPASPTLRSLVPGPQSPVPDSQSSIPAARIDLHIEELVLQGFNHLDQAELGVRVQEALSQLFADQGLPAALNQGGQVNALDGGTFTVQPDAGAGDIAGQIAQAIYRGFGS